MEARVPRGSQRSRCRQLPGAGRHRPGPASEAAFQNCGGQRSSVLRTNRSHPDSLSQVERPEPHVRLSDSPGLGPRPLHFSKAAAPTPRGPGPRGPQHPLGGPALSLSRTEDLPTWQPPAPLWGGRPVSSGPGGPAAPTPLLTPTALFLIVPLGPRACLF